MTVEDGISSYYEQKAAASRATWAKVSEALADGASETTIAELTEAAIDAGNTGD